MVRIRVRPHPHPLPPGEGICYIPSQMAHGWLRHLGGARVEVESAGTAPKGVHPLAVQVMAEEGIEISHHTPIHVDRYAAQDFDLVLTVCDSARESCP